MNDTQPPRKTHDAAYSQGMLHRLQREIARDDDEIQSIAVVTIRHDGTHTIESADTELATRLQVPRDLIPTWRSA